MSLKAALEHAKKHVTYPATKAQLVQACNIISDIPKADKEWFEKNLPNKQYSKPVEVFAALLEKV